MRDKFSLGGSGYFRPREISGIAGGFTLLEILVVLAIVGLLAGMVLPQLQKMASSVEISNQRTDIKLAIEGLGYQVYATGKPVVLADVAAISATESTKPDHPLRIPAGWKIQVLQPVRYAINGVCSGGRIAITDPNQVREAFLLRPPRCRLEPMDNSE